jgi:hypothetical protein
MLRTKRRLSRSSYIGVSSTSRPSRLVIFSHVRAAPQQEYWHQRYQWV